MPGYSGYVPTSIYRIGEKPGYSKNLAADALATDKDYAASAQRQYSHAIPMSTYHAQQGLATTNGDYNPSVVEKGSTAKKQLYACRLST